MTSERLWCPPPANPVLPSDEVHVWRAALDLPAPRVQRLSRVLAPDELSRAERFHFEKDRRCFVVARGLLRTIFGRYLHTGPDRLRFAYGPYGKPALAAIPGRDLPCFSLSHSGGMALYAFARGRAVGVDLERLCVDFECDGIAAQFFSPQEQAILRDLPAEIKPIAFFNCWTRKEAYVKARGEGLSLPLDRFDVSLIPGEPARLLNTCGDPRGAACWSLEELHPGLDYVAALAVEGHGWRLGCWQWTG